jgi:hypothetical protein
MNNWLLIPFYTDPNSSDYSDKVVRFKDFATSAKDVSGLKLAVVDDGSELDPEDFYDVADLLVSIPQNGGKANAVRQGLKALTTDPEINPDYIVQYDGDGDQSFTDIPQFEGELLRASGGNPDNPALVIGDRYSEKLAVSPNPDSIAYRQSILIFFGAIANRFGFDVKDWVSGARGYSAEYARRFLERSKSDRYGIEAEQLAIAFLEGASVGRVPLTYSRPRDPQTETTKWLQNFDAFALHEDDLRKQGQGDLMDLVGELRSNLRAEIDEFNLDLEPIGTPTEIGFRRVDGFGVGTAYTANVPYEFRTSYFDGEGPFLGGRKEEFLN